MLYAEPLTSVLLYYHAKLIYKRQYLFTLQVSRYSLFGFPENLRKLLSDCVVTIHIVTSIPVKMINI